MAETIPVALFVYARAAHLARVLADLRANGVPLLCVFADGAKGEGDAAAVAETRIQVLDLAKPQSATRETQSRQRRFHDVHRARIGWRHRRSPDQFSSESYGIDQIGRGHQHSL